MKIIVLHGWGQNKELWREFQSHFPDGEAIVFDLPGFGNEPLVSGDWGVPEYTTWVQNKIENLGESNIVLLGHSFGGRIASFLAAKNPTWLKGLVLYGSPVLYRPRRSIRLRIAAAKVLKKLGFSGPGGNKELREADDKKMGRIFRNVVSFDQADFLGRIKVPTLIVWGRQDRAVPLRIANEIHRLIPESKLIIMDNVGHNAHLENSNLFYGTIKKFIETL